MVSHIKARTWLRVFENRVMRKISGAKRKQVTGEWRRLLSENFHDFYSSANIIRVCKPRRGRWAGHVARMGEKEMYSGIWCRN